MLQYLDKRDFLKPEGLDAMQLRGILLTCVTPPELLNHLASLNIPVVLLDQPPMDCRVHSVTVDNFEAAYDATLRLIGLGHTRLAFVRSLVSNLQRIDPDSAERQTGFVMACMDAGLTEEHYEIFSAGFGETSAAAIELVRARRPFTGVVACSSFHAEQIELAARSAGLQIPGDLSIEAFHTQEVSRNWSGPRIDLSEIGRRGVEVIERKPGTIERIYVHAAWNRGDSAARPGKNHV
jgi:LacI family transcriptional regulator